MRLSFNTYINIYNNQSKFCVFNIFMSNGNLLSKMEAKTNLGLNWCSIDVDDMIISATCHAINREHPIVLCSVRGN